MPGYLSHYLFCIGTAKHLQDSKANPILLTHKKTFCLGGEGPDIFLYYLPTHFKKPSLGHRLHQTKTKEFLYWGIKTIMTKQTKIEKEVLYAYLSGLICHYTLDTIAHPYVEAFANPNKNKTSKSVNSYQHCLFETTLDTNLLFKYLRKFPSEQSFFTITNPDKSKRRMIASFLSSTCNNAYKNENNYSNISASHMYRVVSLFPYAASCLHDKSGLKKPLLNAIERILHSPLRPSCVISSDDLQMDQDVLNLKHREWRSPFEPKRIRNESFIDLFKSGVHTSYKRCQILYSIIFECDDKEQQNFLSNILLEDLGNLSYNTGLTL